MGKCNKNVITWMSKIPFGVQKSAAGGFEQILKKK